MSRTIRGSKAVGYDYWSKRPMNKGGGLVGKFTKTCGKPLSLGGGWTAQENEVFLAFDF